MQNIYLHLRDINFVCTFQIEVQQTATFFMVSNL